MLLSHRTFAVNQYSLGDALLSSLATVAGHISAVVAILASQLISDTISEEAKLENTSIFVCKKL